VSALPLLFTIGWLFKGNLSFWGAIDEENNETGEKIPGRWRSEIRVLRDLEKYGGHRTTKLAKKLWDQLKAHFNTL
jgi:hypothetical protein